MIIRDVIMVQYIDYDELQNIIKKKRVTIVDGVLSEDDYKKCFKRRPFIKNPIINIWLPYSVKEIESIDYSKWKFDKHYNPSLHLKDFNAKNLRKLNDRFFEYSEVKNILLPKVEIIGKEAFSYCLNLKNVWIDNVKYINEGAFSFSNISEIDLSNVIHIEKNSFRGCENLSQILINPGAKVNDNIFGFGSEKFINSMKLKVRKR